MSPMQPQKSLFQQLESFPKVSAKDHLKLGKLGDLLMETEGAKEDGYLTGLSYQLILLRREQWLLSSLWVLLQICVLLGKEVKRPQVHYQPSTTTHTKLVRSTSSYVNPIKKP